MKRVEPRQCTKEAKRPEIPDDCKVIKHCSATNEKEMPLRNIYIY